MGGAHVSDVKGVVTVGGGEEEGSFFVFLIFWFVLFLFRLEGINWGRKEKKKKEKRKQRKKPYLGFSRALI